nr:MAG TPA: protein of unknown function DUF4406 [Caudoviricetes sp.]
MVRLRDGQVRGPIKETHDTGPYLLTDEKTSWTINGSYLEGHTSYLDIVEIAEFFPFYKPDVAESITKSAQEIIKNHPFTVDTDGVVLTEKASHGRIYLAGPMAGYPEQNYPAFMRAAKALRDLGYEVYNPAEYEANGTDEFPLREAFTEYANYILNRADIIALLPGYEKSVGATAELSLARVVKLKEIYL